jgi:hypothetical protein
MTYNGASSACLAHALALSVSVWLVVASDLIVSDLTLRLLATVWVLLLIAWPAWGFVVWKAAKRKVSRTLHTLFVGLLFICPSFLLLFLIHGLRHQADFAH